MAAAIGGRKEKRDIKGTEGACRNWVEGSSSLFLCF